jgi:Mn-containing catalase
MSSGTGIDLPDMIYNLYAQELNRITRELVIKIADDYNLEDQLEIMLKRYTCDIDIINRKVQNIEIIKKHNYNSNLQPEQRCQARVWYKGLGAQCKRSRYIEDLCHIHHKLILSDPDKKLKYGRISDPRPDLFKNNKNTRTSVY